MKCPNDNSEMEIGFINLGHWASGQKPKLGGVLTFGRKSIWVNAYRCPKCGKVELTTEVK